jgi:hypothetical protein
MNHLLASTAVVLVLGLTPALAADKAAPVPGAADTSTGAAQQSSAPPGSKSEMDSTAPCVTPGASMDKSSGAAEQSSAPPCSAAADTSKPDPNGTAQ